MAARLELHAKARPLLFVAALLCFAVVGVFVLGTHQGIRTDDEYITYQCARNLALGHGLVFNVGERYLSTSAPFYAVILAVLGKFDVDAIPGISIGISFLSLLAISAAFLAFGDAMGKPWFGFLAGLFCLPMPAVWYAIGFEVLPQIACTLWGFYFFLRARDARRPAYAAAVLLAVATLLRPDGILGAGAVVLWLLASVLKNSSADAAKSNAEGALAEVRTFVREFRLRVALESRSVSLKMIGLYASLLVFAAALTALYYGSSLPGTKDAKAAQADSRHWNSFLTGGQVWFLQKFPRDYPVILVLYGLAFLGCVFLPRRPRVVLLVGWTCLHTLAFKVGHLPFYPWYYAPEGIGVAVLAALGLSELVARRNAMVVVRWAAAGIALFASWHITSGLLDGLSGDARSYPRTFPQDVLYPRAADWIVKNTQPTDRIGYYEIGLLAWYTQRRFVDPLGLCTPGQADNVRRAAFDGAYRQFEPEWILKFQRSGQVLEKDGSQRTVWVSVFGLDPDKKRWFEACYAHAADITVDDYRISVYRKVDSYAAWRKRRYERREG